MSVEKPVPYSIYDIRGLQEWLDEQALQGLLLEDFSPRFDRAGFRMEEPRPVRYRLDPVVRPNKRDPALDENYAQMGWEYVCHIPNYYYVYCCADPDAPELYSDPQSLSLAMDGIVGRAERNTVFWALGLLIVWAIPFLINARQTFQELLLWENPRYLSACVLYPVLMVVLVVLFLLQVKKLRNIRRTLAQGLPLKAGRRWNRPNFLLWYIPLWLALSILPRALLPNLAGEYRSLDAMTPSCRPWPSLVQTEALGPHPLEMSPSRHGYVIENSSWPAPVQETRSIDWEVRFPSKSVPSNTEYWTRIRYVQARSPKLAELIFQLELEDAAETLENWSSWTDHEFHITGSAAFTPWDWPGADRLEVARYRQCGQDSWTLAALRGTDILVVNYVGFAQPEDCANLFLAALDGEEANS